MATAPFAHCNTCDEDLTPDGTAQKARDAREEHQAEVVSEGDEPHDVTIFKELDEI